MFNRPWIGTDFADQANLVGGKRVLVLGESIHDADHSVGTQIPDHNNQLMGEYLARAPATGAKRPLRWLRTFDNMAWALSGKGPDELRKSSNETKVWEAVAFYNYVSTIVGEASRTRPSSAQFRDAANDFETALDIVRPQVVVCWGFELFGWVIRNHFPEYPKPWDFGGGWIDLPRNPLVRIVRMKHPSAGFSHTQWHRVIAEAVLDC